MSLYLTDNYRKYPSVKESMIQVLQEDVTAKEAAKRLGISIPTLHKYKNILMIEEKEVFMTRDEASYLRRHPIPARGVYSGGSEKKNEPILTTEENAPFAEKSANENQHPEQPSPTDASADSKQASQKSKKK